MSPFDVCVLAGASFALTRAWYRGDMFAAARQYAAAWKEMPTGIRSHLGHLLSCPLCLSFNFCVLLGPLFWLPGATGLLCKVLLYSIAASSLVPLSFLGNNGDQSVPEKESMPKEEDVKLPTAELPIRLLFMKELERVCEATMDKYIDKDVEVVIVTVVDKKKSLQTGNMTLVFPSNNDSAGEEEMLHILSQMGTMQSILCQLILKTSLAANKKATTNGTDAEEGQDPQREEDNPHPA